MRMKILLSAILALFTAQSSFATPQTPRQPYQLEEQASPKKKSCCRCGGKTFWVAMTFSALALGGGYFLTTLEEEGDLVGYGSIAMLIGCGTALGTAAWSTCSTCMDCCGCTGQDAQNTADFVNDVVEAGAACGCF